MGDKPLFYSAKKMDELDYHLKNTPHLHILAGGTRMLDGTRSQSKLVLPSPCLCIRGIRELQEISKKERYIDFGAAVSLADILSRGRQSVPTVLYRAIESIANRFVRNIATIGGNIAPSPLSAGAAGGRGSDYKMTSYAAFLALDAQVQVHSAAGDGKFQSLAQFTGCDENTIISRLRVPTDEWTLSLFRKVGSPAALTGESAAFVFLAKVQKNTLQDLRIACAGSFVFRNRDYENSLTGASLPLSRRAIDEAIESFDAIFSPVLPPTSSPLIARQCKNALAQCLRLFQSTIA